MSISVQYMCFYFFGGAGVVLVFASGVRHSPSNVAEKQWNVVKIITFWANDHSKCCSVVSILPIDISVRRKIAEKLSRSSGKRSKSSDWNG